MRRNYYIKNRKKPYKRIIAQIIICIIIVITVIGIKKADMTMTNRIFKVIETGLSVEYNFKELPKKAWSAMKKAPEIPLKVAQVFNKNDNTLAFSPPIDNGEVVSTFGTSFEPITESSSFQRGVDYYSDRELTIYSIGDGLVTEIGNSNVYGDYIKIHHGNQIFSIYGGCSNIYIEDAQSVKKGDILASANTDSDNETCFHFELWVDGEVVDPNEYIDLD